MVDHQRNAAKVAEPDRIIDVDVGFDEVTKVYFILASGLAGLHVETPTFEDFVEVVLDAAPDLLGGFVGSARFNFRREIDLIPSGGR